MTWLSRWLNRALAWLLFPRRTRERWAIGPDGRWRRKRYWERQRDEQREAKRRYVGYHLPYDPPGAVRP
jgi:hypothetical protein